jgi:hypothetical protein
MAILLRIKVADAKPIRQGSEFFWETLMAMSADDKLVTYKALDGACDPGQEGSLRDFIKRMIAAGVIEKATAKPVSYRVVKRQPTCPIISNDGEMSKVGCAQQQMWNVIRRAHGGFTAPDLAIDASTDDVTVSRDHARSYCNLLRKAGIVTIQTRGKPARSHNIYVLKGSANTGPRAPRKVKAKGIFDPNRGVIVGDLIAEEDSL